MQKNNFSHCNLYLGKQYATESIKTHLQRKFIASEQSSFIQLKPEGHIGLNQVA